MSDAARMVEIARALDSERISNIQCLDILTGMVLDLYAQNIALRSMVGAMKSGASASAHARDVVANTLGREGYDETPDVEHLRRVAVALRNI